MFKDMSLFSYQSSVCFSVILFCSLATAFILYHIFLCLSSTFLTFFETVFSEPVSSCGPPERGLSEVWKAFELRELFVQFVQFSWRQTIYYTTFPVLSTPFFIFFEDTFFYFFRGHWKQGAGRRRNAVKTKTLAEGGMQSI